MVPDFSIIIPVYNDEEYLTECLESVIKQTYPNIEIICVNDGSADGSAQILERYARKDERFNIITEKRNVGTSKARKDGVLTSKGKYVLFLDADDFLVPDACEKLMTVPEECEIVHFGIQVVSCGDMRAASITSMENYLMPCCDTISIDQMQELCFKKTRLAHNLCGKRFDGNLCRKAFSYLVDKRFVMAEDMYAFFAITIMSKSYIGISDKLYIYNYGRGITGEDKPLVKSFEAYCSQAGVVEACYKLAQDLKEEEKYRDILECIRKNAIETCTKFLSLNERKIDEDIASILQEQFCKSWAKEDMSAELLRMCRKYQKSQENVKEKHWLFPFDKVEKNARIVIYGAGDVGQDYYKQLVQTGFCEVVAVADKSYEKYTDCEYEVCAPEKIAELEFDYVVLAIRADKIRAIVKENLLQMKSSIRFIEGE